MENTSENIFDNISNITKSIESTAQKILVKYVKFMKDIADDNSKIIKKNMKEGEESKIVGEQLFELVSSRVKDAENVIEEMDNFIVVMSNSFSDINGKIKKKELINKCPFMASVWLGDVYGEKGIDGLKLLKEDLVKQLSEAKSKNLIRN